MALAGVFATPCGPLRIEGDRPSFVQDVWIESVLKDACNELVARGYGKKLKQKPLPFVFSSQIAESHTAGLWLDGKVFLPSWIRDSNQLMLTVRHEFMHAMTQVHCPNFPIWAHEAAAISFSGELHDRFNASKTFRSSEKAEETRRQNLIQGLAEYPWPAEPCAIQKELAHQFKQTEAVQMAPRNFAYRIVHLASGRVYGHQGSQTDVAPAGSLLKLAWFASLPDELQTHSDIQKAILKSDSKSLLGQSNKAVDRLKLKTFLDFSGSNSWLLAPENSPQIIQQRLSQAMGDRDVLWSLERLGLMLRQLILTSNVEHLQFLQKNGRVASSTLADSSDSQKSLLRQLQALAKTGTNRDQAEHGLGDITWGHLLIVWPAKKPEFMAIFRASRLRGAKLLSKAEPILRDFIKEYPIQETYVVRVLLDTKKVPHSLATDAKCPFSVRPVSADSSLLRSWQKDTNPGWIFSPCRSLQLLSGNLRRPVFPHKSVQGLLRERQGRWELLTDIESYTDAVLMAEGAELKGSARQAFRSIIFANAGFRKDGICASTRCMVYVGQPAEESREQTSRSLIQKSRSLARRHKELWLPFSAGGSKAWTNELPGYRVEKILKFPSLFQMERLALRGGIVKVRLLSDHQQLELGCDSFQTLLKLPSCPTSISYAAKTQSWTFSGNGLGHGRGFLVQEAQQLALLGWNAESLLQWAYARKTKMSGLAVQN